ncbi:hypothetical protein CBOM_07400 [Ceraceosorus bombacis]|uniref:Uncharacterized protein n=1 Tax=Ceraceosorus bombacis TaxID=401625 RepID=A0A0P1BB72_9BASI|nr:hypothetical protein CBOM_07400 [Ceraceosorus bombacis]
MSTTCCTWHGGPHLWHKLLQGSNVIEDDCLNTCLNSSRLGGWGQPFVTLAASSRAMTASWYLLEGIEGLNW